MHNTRVRCRLALRMLLVRAFGNLKRMSAALCLRKSWVVGAECMRAILLRRTLRNPYTHTCARKR